VAAYAGGSLRLMALPVLVESTVTFMIMLAPVARRWRLKARTNRPGRTRAIGASCHIAAMPACRSDSDSDSELATNCQ
jgi:hypothetical protein